MNEHISAEGRTDWDQVYARSAESGGWAYLSAIIVRTLVREIGPPAGRTLLEAGSGSGRNSLRLASLEARVTLLDIAGGVLAAARERFDRSGRRADVVQGSIMAMPLRDDCFDRVWNAGVIEHWTGEPQAQCLREMLRVCRKDGIVVTLNPFAGSLLFSIGRRRLMKKGQFAFHDEVPIRALESQAQAAGGVLLKKEYSIGFFALFVGGFLYLAQAKGGRLAWGMFRALNALFSRLDASWAGRLLDATDRALSRWFGGYLLVSVIGKK